MDDELGYVYYADENARHPQVARPIPMRRARTGARAVRDRPATSRIAKGSASTRCADGTGYIVSVDQLPGDSVFTSTGGRGARAAARSLRGIALFRSGADGTDGLDVTSATSARSFPGLLVAMNSTSQNFLLFRWRDLQRFLGFGGS